MKKELRKYNEPHCETNRQIPERERERQKGLKNNNQNFLESTPLSLAGTTAQVPSHVIQLLLKWAGFYYRFLINYFSNFNERNIQLDKSPA